MLRIQIQKTTDDFVVAFEGNIEDLSTASASLLDIVPHEFVRAADGFLRVDPQAAQYLDAWLRAVRATHRFSKIVWLPRIDS